MRYQQKIIFITGASRSGTTLLSFVLRKHHDIFGLKETLYFGQYSIPKNFEKKLTENELIEAAAIIFARQERGPAVGKPISCDYQKAKEFVKGLSEDDKTGPGLYAKVVEAMGVDAGKNIVCEQTPRNIFYAKKLLEIYPNSYVVHMMRDPRGVLSSQKKRWQLRRHTNKKMSLWKMFRVFANYHPFTMAKLWNSASTTAHELLDHPRFILVRFEDLIQNPEMTVRKLCQSLNVTYQDQLLEINQINSSFHSENEASKGFNTQTTDAWRKILNKNEIAISEQLSGTLMEKFGYQNYEKSGNRFVAGLLYSLYYPLHAAGVMIANPYRAWIHLREFVRIG